MANAKSDSRIYRPEELAAEIGISGKVLRGHLRSRYPRPIEAKGSTWLLSAEVADEVREHFANRRAATVVTSDSAKSE